MGQKKLRTTDLLLSCQKQNTHHLK